MIMDWNIVYGRSLVQGIRHGPEWLYEANTRAAFHRESDESGSALAVALHWPKNGVRHNGFDERFLCFLHSPSAS